MLAVTGIAALKLLMMANSEIILKKKPETACCAVSGFFVFQILDMAFKQVVG